MNFTGPILGLIVLISAATFLSDCAEATSQTCSIANCKICTDPPQQCDACQVVKDSPNVLKGDKSACLGCPSNCNSCSEGTEGTSVCTKCNPFFYKSGDTCHHCPGHCETCSTTGVCSKCESKYSKISAKTSCFSCPTNCETCADSNTCWTCKAGYYMDSDGNCKICKGGSNCLSCEDDKVCLKCNKMKWTGTTCKSCHAQCDTCDTTDGCTKCKTGYFISKTNKDDCLKCENCAGQCSDKNGCNQCKPGYHQIPDGRCAACPSQESGVCEKCNGVNRARLYINDKCDYCPANCDSCAATDDCDTCKPGYTWVTDKCKKCDSLQPEDLTVLGNSQPFCDVCNAQNVYYKEATKCLKCPSTDAEFDADEKACEKCKDAKLEPKYVCEELNCAGTVSDETLCDRCNNQGLARYYDAGSCKTVTDCSALTTLTEPECKACKNTRWTTECIALDCNAITTWNEDDCLKCNRIWTNPSTCTGRGTTCKAETTETDCNCAGWGWDGEVCKELSSFSCGSSDLVNLNSYECDSCTRKLFEANTAGTATKTTSFNAKTGSNKCYNCPANCDVCSVAAGVVTCTTCKSGYSKDGNICKACDTGCTDCDHTTNECKTGKCDLTNGFYASGTSCAACDAHCDECTGSGQCTQCSDGYTWDTDLAACVACVISDAKSCTGCLDTAGGDTTGFYFDSDDLCRICPKGCTECDSDGVVCTACGVGYYLKTSGSTQTCASCPSLIGSVTTSEVCDACGVHYGGAEGTNAFWNSETTKCIACITRCTSCQDATTCSTCKKGYYYAAPENDGDSGQCKTCLTDCLACSSENTCSECKPDMYLDKSGTTPKCKNCPSKCTQCSHANGCSSCETKYFLDGQTCKSCSSEIDSNCQACNSKTSCTKCSTGYFSESTKCTACISNCDACDDATTCTKCSSGYCYDSSKKKCLASTGCKTCKSDSADQVTCLECYPNYGLSICEACTPSNCIQCDKDKTKCQKCDSGFYLENEACVLCPGGTNCKACSGNTKCSKCKDGYFWDTKTKDCKSCGTDCTMCSSDTVCTRCKDDNMFWNKTSKECKDCPAGCSACNDDISCNTCNNGTIWDSKEKSCVECLTNCWTCLNTTQCNTCLPEYYLSTSDSTQSCEACSDGCVTCEAVNDTSICIECKKGYALNAAGACEVCTIEACDVCSDPATLCSTCNSGYVLSTDKATCRSPAAPCYMCSGSGCDTPGSNTTSEPCEGMPQKASCLTTMTETAGVQTYSRSCQKEYCSSTEESCTTSGTTTTCTQCCKTSNCNKGTLAGKVEATDESSASRLKMSSILFITMAILLQ